MMEKRHTQSDGRIWSTRWRLGGQTSLEVGCRKTLPCVVERLRTDPWSSRESEICFTVSGIYKGERIPFPEIR
jgi:hypothetical protein